VLLTRSVLKVVVGGLVLLARLVLHKDRLVLLVRLVLLDLREQVLLDLLVLQVQRVRLVLLGRVLLVLWVRLVRLVMWVRLDLLELVEGHILWTPVSMRFVSMRVECFSSTKMWVERPMRFSV